MQKFNPATTVIASVCAALFLGGVACSNDNNPNDDAPPPGVDPNLINCENYAVDQSATFREETFNCGELDRCDPATDPTFGFVCCECDLEYCRPDPNCGPVDPVPDPGNVESCMNCHNGSAANDYAGAGITNPHPFPGASLITCSECHGGDPNGSGKLGSHVPPPPEICPNPNDCDNFLQLDEQAYFNRLTLAGIDKMPDYNVAGVDYTALDYLQFINPGDLRVNQEGRSCANSGCHSGGHVESTLRGPIAYEQGILSGALFSAGLSGPNGYYENTEAFYAFRAQSDPGFAGPSMTENIGRVGSTQEFPEVGQFNGIMFNNNAYNAANLANQVTNNAVLGENQIIPGTELADVFSEQIAITCGDCHAGSAGANNRYADFRSSGCTSCHMEYSLDGRSRSTDPNVPKNEPANPDAIAAPERPHIEAHTIRNVAKFIGGAFLRGVSDNACVGCHQGSNRTVLQFWGIRLDQNQDLTNNFQYPNNPNNFTNTANDTRLYDPAIANNTFNGRNADQYILYEDYDGDNRDDTPADVHYEAGLGCIDCHGAADLHNGPKPDGTEDYLYSRQDQVVKITCESCHGGLDTYAQTEECTTYTNEIAQCATDSKGNSLRHVTRDAQNNFFLRSRLTGTVHYIPQTRDTIVNNGKVNPINQQAIYSPKASYAMGRYNGSLQDGVGPQQTDPNLNITPEFTHLDDLDCVSCHASWTNSCIGCHLHTEYDANPANYFFSNITGERILLNEANADFVYQSPILYYLGVNSRNKITKISPAEKVFYRYTDLNGDESAVFAFSDANGYGNNPNGATTSNAGALGHNQMAAHSIRGKVLDDREGPTYCVGCHLNVDQINNFGADYAQFFDIMANQDFNAYTDNNYFALLQNEIGLNTGNQNNNPYWVHMAAGLGSGLFWFDANGCPVNPLDNNANREYCNGVAPADQFDPNNVVYDLDRVVELTGANNASNAHPMLDPVDAAINAKRAGPNVNLRLAGPLGPNLLLRLADPNGQLVLDSWIDANADAQGDAANYIQ